MSAETTRLTVPMPPRAKVWLHRGGTLLSLAAILFVGLKLYDYGGELGEMAIGPLAYAGLAALALVYGAANLLLALAWRAVLRWLGVATMREWAVWAYATSQLAKYVPGNVFQFAGRQALGAAAGLPNWPLAKSAGLELALLSLAGLLFAPLVLPGLVPGVGVALSVTVFVIGVAGAILLARLVGGPTMALAFAGYSAFLAISGAIFLLTLQLAGHGALAGSTAPLVTGAYVLAWLAGLVTPGAPAGLGVREAVLLFFLSGLEESGIVLAAVVMGRAITVIGDVLFYAAGRFITPVRVRVE